MSCPDWQSLVELRDNQPEVWDSALQHLDECGNCQPEAVDADPLLLFRQLPTLEASESEVEATKQAVAALRRTESIRQNITPRSPFSASWMRAAAVIAILVATAFWGVRLTEPEPTVIAALEQWESSEALEALSADPAMPGTVDSSEPIEYMPLVEDADPSHGSIIQVVDQDMSIVVVVPSQMDV